MRTSGLYEMGMGANPQQGLVGDDLFEQMLGRSMVTMPLGLNFVDGFLRPNEEYTYVGGNTNITNISNCAASTTSGITDKDSLHIANFFPVFGQSVHPPPPGPLQLQQPFQSQPTSGTVSAAPQPPVVRPRARARRGQATDPHSIAERLRRERISERMKALQELVPTSNKSDKAAMLDEILDYVKFLRLQVKVLSMSRLGATGTGGLLAADLPLSSVEEESLEGGTNQEAWEKWSNDVTEQEVAKLVEEDIGAAMHFLQTKALCIVPISLASAMFRTRLPDLASVNSQA
ncbi:hypothetical protein HS088_TW11G00587 [Tripterygium wilfordii]|uniref:BHLH domain-containing protein n=1 Tax=Tripterygium wilfordii TaxID=458696 RepID=A0A7J7D2E2_TRIWF|nr:hypothetical protein HS088_TW11G00587 [Tripterygium wilfordii]